MDKTKLRQMLDDVASGSLSAENAFKSLNGQDYDNMEYAILDYQRELRCGYPEVVFGLGKTPEQVAGIMERLAAQHQGNILATRCTGEHFVKVQQVVPEAKFDKTSGLIYLHRDHAEKGCVAVLAAGTSDLNIAEEAAITAQLMGARVERRYDVGVAGLHRTLAQLDLLKEAKVIVVVAGMEGALPSVIGGLAACPVIAVPTSVGYGANFGGLSALLTMLNSCASGVAVVNIDNGFGGGYLAAIINNQSVDK